MAIFSVLVMLSLFTIPVLLLLMIIRSIFKKGPGIKKLSIILASAVVLFIISGILAPELTDEQKGDLEKSRQERLATKQERQQEQGKLKAEKEAEKVSANKKEEELEKEKAEKQAEKKRIAREKQKKDLAEKQAKEEQAAKEKTEKEKHVADQRKEKREKDKKQAAAKEKANSINHTTDNKHLYKLLHKKNSEIKSVQVKDGIPIIILKPTAVWSENSLFSNFAVDSSEIMNDLKKNNNFKGIGVVKQMDMTDQKGNESTERVIIAYFNKDNYDDINFSNFTNALYGTPSNFYEVSDGYWIHPGIYQNIKDETLNGLPFVPINQSEGFEMVSRETSD